MDPTNPSGRRASDERLDDVTRRSRRASTGEPPRLAQLQALLEELLGLHRELVEVMARKLAAMRGANVVEIEACVEREGQLAARIQRQEGLRRCVVQHLARDLGWSAPAGVNPLLRDLAGRVEACCGRRLGQLGSELAQVLQELAELNGRATAVTRQMQTWHRALLDEAAGVFGAGLVYGRTGHARRPPHPQVIDTTS